MSTTFLDRLQRIHEQANALHALHQQDLDGPLARLLGHASYVGIAHHSELQSVLLQVDPVNNVEVNDLKLLCAELPEFNWAREPYCGAVSWNGEAHGFKIRIANMEPHALEAIVFKREEALV